MDFLKTLLVFVICLTILLLFNAFVAIPILPCITIYIFASLTLEKFNVTNITVYNVFLLLLGICSIVLYILNICETIVFYPKFGNWISVIFDILTTFAFISATAIHYMTKEKLK